MAVQPFFPINFASDIICIPSYDDNFMGRSALRLNFCGEFLLASAVDRRIVVTAFIFLLFFSLARTEL